MQPLEIRRLGTVLYADARTAASPGRRTPRGSHSARPTYEARQHSHVLLTDPAEVEGERLDDSLAACRDRLVDEGVDLNGYNTPQNAADLADLRVALGIDEWNLRGVSYGSALAIETIRSHPEGLHAVLLDSIVVARRAVRGGGPGRERRCGRSTS